ncbi:MAG: hypothetical protein K2L11_03320 [Muribaculaceae bacterium]|nr:hypothetical protein [Muribaculaceae bacterium]
MAIGYDNLRKRFPDISPMVLALPLEGLEATDPDNDNEDRINENFKNAFLNSMEREIEKRRILSKWLNS